MWGGINPEAKSPDIRTGLVLGEGWERKWGRGTNKEAEVVRVVAGSLGWDRVTEAGGEAHERGLGQFEMPQRGKENVWQEGIELSYLYLNFPYPWLILVSLKRETLIWEFGRFWHTVWYVEVGHECALKGCHHIRERIQSTRLLCLHCLLITSLRRSDL